MIRQTKLILGTNPGDIAYLNKRFTLGKFVGWALGGWGLKDWLLPSVFIGRGDGPDFDNIVRNTLKSSSAIEKVNWFDSHFACYTEPDLLESPYPEHTFQFGGPILLNTEARRAERIEQEWHGKDGSLIDVQPLNVATDSHTEVAVVGNMKVYNGVWQGPRDSWKRDSAKPELTAPFHSPVWYRNIFISKNADQPSEHFGDNVSAETHQECMKEHIEFTSKFHKEYTWW